MFSTLRPNRLAGNQLRHRPSWLLLDSLEIVDYLPILEHLK